MKHGKSYFKIFDTNKYKVGLVCAKFNSEVTDKILVSALNKLRDYKIKKENIDIYFVSGSVEIPVMLQFLARQNKYDCLFALGAIIKGATHHYEYVAKMVSEGIMRVMLDNIIPIGFGVLTCQNKKLALDRCSIGADAVIAALHTKKNFKIFKK